MGAMVNGADQVKQRRAAMAMIKDELARRERTQTWLIRRLAEKGIETSRQTLSNYLNGYRRVPRVLLAEACAITGTTMERILAAIGDEAVLIQASKPTNGNNPDKAA